MRCLTCGIPMYTRTYRKDRPGRLHQGRGLCSVCYHYLRKRGRLQDYPRRTVSA